MKNWLNKLVKLGFWGFVAFELAIMLGATMIPRTAAELPEGSVIIVLGAGGEDNQLQQPSIDRAVTAARVWKDAKFKPMLFFTGGRDAPENMAISQMMANIAMDLGVPNSHIDWEVKSQSTIQNLLYAKEKMGKAPPHITLISHGFHLPRAWWAARGLGFEHISLVRTDVTYSPLFPNGIYILSREALAWPTNMLRLIGYRTNTLGESLMV